MNFKEIKELLMLIDNTKLEYVKLNTSDIELEVYKKVVGNIEIGTKNTSVVENKENNIEKVSATNNRTNEENNIINTNDTLEYELVKEDVVEFVGENLKEVKAPLIGTFYESPDPDSPAFVSVGDHVEKGDTLCIVEAMKLMNEIKSEFTGKVVEIKAANESMVEYGQTLFVIEED
ncbi:biotin/lipoyl-containing protein [Peptoclostridium sp. AF21-18]|uniref:biotin/lipoyl-containing protein n=1 Tax=Peptoclostridium sp. AF21-18 TaxID=2292243 RepID=UPI000E47A2FE|nr:biotin/lipoyl-containing protein [Peptoclostridium sp. AF21-18]RHQ96019.1 acetyl-CoA carboxylase, biotin carboxyl carrier protein [Peptoclostridium sp. AF21-18]